MQNQDGYRTFYAHNIADMGVAIPNCMEEHCMVLIQPVYPTPIYEFLMCFAIFVFLTAIGRRLTFKPGMVLALFMTLIGIERLSIERIRDISSRELYNIFGLALRQSEIISIVLIVSGAVFMGWLWRKYRRQPAIR
jgi:phosphatidylglycerol:prolipoprotein diacylglycerol transferase